MLTSLALIFLFGLAASALFRRLHLPDIIGMLLVGIVLGPYVLDALDPSILGISGDLRQLALIIILLKAGFSLRLSDLRAVGRPAVLLSFLPAACEMLAYLLLAPLLFGITRLEAGIMGAVLSAVSPAVVVPRMVRLIEEGRGTDKAIPQMILTGASCDDVFVIVIFTAFLNMAQGGAAGAADLAGIPVSILLGILTGAAAGWLLALFFESLHRRGSSIRNSKKLLIILSAAFLFVALERSVKQTLPLSGLLAVMSMALVLNMQSVEHVAQSLSSKLGKSWLAAELLLFVLVGAAVDIRYTLKAGLPAAAMIFAALVLRSLGVSLCLLQTPLSLKERLFCLIAYLPKATVQAAIGSVPLSLGLPCGSLILSVAVLGILITAPLGAFGIDLSARHFLTAEAKK